MASRSRTATKPSARTKTSSSVPTSRVTRANTASNVAASFAPPAASKKALSRKPLVDRENTAENVMPEPKGSQKQLSRTASKGQTKLISVPNETDREPIMAYLRIRPYLGEDEPTSVPYLTTFSNTDVRMTDPRHDPQTKSSALRPSVLPQSSVYTFSHVFPTLTTQSEFFTKTTLPLVKDVLEGQNALLFTYGVTNSGKTFTVHGGNEEGSAGIVQRTLDVMFNSIEGLQGDGRFRPVRLRGIEASDATDTQSPHLLITLPQPVLGEVMAEHLIPTASDTDMDPTALKLDRNFEYSIWLSYAEVYNEKVYDLLETVKDGAKPPSGRNGTTNGIHPLLLTRKALPLKPCPLSDYDSSAASSGKYISGLRQFRVRSASQAKALVKLGQIHRRVFGTLANKESSRSHGLVIIKVVKVHRGERDDPSAFQVSRFTLVDLAGSERTKHTHTTGDRLKEAGNINKSLMVLGQCMEVMRANQRRVAMSLAGEGIGRVDTRDVKKTLAVVPFRHSKLTEALMDYFVEEGRVVMIVNVNPYDTGYDENSNVMKFAALAREVYVSPTPAYQNRLLSRPTVKGSLPRNDATPHRRKVTISMGNGRKVSEAVVEVLEEDEAAEEGGDDDEPMNPLIDALFDEVEELRMRLFESEMKCVIVEAETREEVMREMEEQMRGMEKMFAKRLMNEVMQNEMKTDAKIDMLQQSGLLVSSPSKHQMAMRLFEECPAASLRRGSDEEEIALESDQESASEQISSSRSPSPLARKAKHESVQTIVTSTGRRETRQYVPDGPAGLLLPSDDEEMTDDPTETDTEDGTEDPESADDTDDGAEDLESVGETETRTESTSDHEVEYEVPIVFSDDEDEWVPTSARTPRATKLNDRRQQQASSSSTASRDNETRPRSTRQSSRGTARLAREMNKLSIASTAADPLDLLRVRDSSTHAMRVVEHEEEDISGTVKKKKRQVGKNSHRN